jgi:hypothetical protein
MKKIIKNGLIAGVLLSIISYGGIFIAISFFPSVFVEYNNPLFSSGGGRDVMFFAHAFIISLALSWVWERYKRLFKGNIFLRGVEFGLVYTITSLLPVMWMNFSAMDITVEMVASWLFYGLIQSVVAGIIFAKISP